MKSALLDTDQPGKIRTTTANTLNRATCKQNGEVLSQSCHKHSNHEQRNCRNDHGHSSKDVTERGKVRLENGRGKQKGCARPESLDSRAIESLRDLG